MATTWFAALAQLRGRVCTRVPATRLSWFRTGGPAEVLFEPADLDDLIAVMQACPDEIPLTVIGAGSNLLIRDGGIPGLVIRLQARFAQLEIVGDRIKAGAAALDYRVASSACMAGIGGLTFLSGIPGRIGGAVKMNAGAYGSEMAGVIQAADVVDVHGRLYRLSPERLGLGYRTSKLPQRCIVVGAQLRGWRCEPAVLAAELEKIKQAKTVSQPGKSRCCGSIFANPPGMDKAWRLIERAGCRGWRYGGAQISPQHCNFLINTGSASAGELETLGELVRQQVYEREGVWLRWEIERVGVPLKAGAGLP